VVRPVPVDTVRDPAEAVLPELPVVEEVRLEVSTVVRGETTDVDPLTLTPTLRRGSLPVGELRTVPPS
jgi:hypothetical protein